VACEASTSPEAWLNLLLRRSTLPTQGSTLPFLSQVTPLALFSESYLQLTPNLGRYFQIPEFQAMDVCNVLVGK